MDRSAKLSRIAALLEVVIFVALAIVLKRVMDPYFWRYAGPVSLLIVIAILFAYMRFRGERLLSIGLPALPDARSRLLVVPQALLTFAVFAAAIAALLFGSEGLGLEFMSEEPAGVEERWGDIKGDLKLYLLWVVISWVAAGFGEEVAFRGFLITRMQAVLSGAPLAAVWAVLAPALLFGFAHYYYQGLRGLITTTIIGIVFGSMFLAFKRNLWPIIIVHASIDTIGFTARYFDWDV